MNAHTLRVWTAGTNTQVVTVPKFEKDSQNIEEGDFIEVTFKLVKKSKSQKTSKKKFIVDKT
jgi:hypothetical protein